jgi:hypothetical protein
LPAPCRASLDWKAGNLPQPNCDCRTRAERRLGRKTERTFNRMQRQRLRQQGRSAAERTMWLERKGGRR